ncbi:MAG: hypothetical protein NTX48_06745 [Planctomycetales bacterium]|nr:hypothetical protein [Planctomycetales bacterium]
MTPGFYYLTGEPMQTGDRIIANHNQPGVVEYILAAESDEASIHGCLVSGGFMLRFDNGDSQLWVAADEDLEFVSRKV